MKELWGWKCDMLKKLKVIEVGEQRARSTMFLREALEKVMGTVKTSKEGLT